LVLYGVTQYVHPRFDAPKTHLAEWPSFSSRGPDV
jgi:hypothetical protein